MRALQIVRLGREKLRSSLLVLVATLLGMGVAVFALRPLEAPESSNLFGGEISPGTDARVRIDVRAVGGSDFLDEVQTTARLVALDSGFRERLGTLEKCGLHVEVAQGWTAEESSDSSMEFEPALIVSGGDELGRGCFGAVGNTRVEYNEAVAPATRVSRYWYPFDRLVYRVRVGTRYHWFQEGSYLFSDWKFATPELHFTAPGWSIRYSESPVSRIQTTIPQLGGGQLVRFAPGAAVAQAELTRPLAVKLSVVLFLLVLIVAVVSITQVETFGDSLQVAMAVSVLLWTSREALVPGDPKMFLALDVIFLGLGLLVLGNLLLVRWRHGARLESADGIEVNTLAGEAPPGPPLVLVSGSAVVHRPSCPRLKRIGVQRQTEVPRVPRGLRPCRICEPPVNSDGRAFAGKS
ncbi:MAG: hypothetical protein SF066_18560 [Thermoanaerobaculia bacterium]|nr:hypothetical protein [Thermoanaerobaculia bacterium]